MFSCPVQVSERGRNGVFIYSYLLLIFIYLFIQCAPVWVSGLVLQATAGRARDKPRRGVLRN